ncbi:MAG: DEAD/DEAH box helicase [Planctomycetota bacterium]
MLSLRDYQRDAIECVERELWEGDRPSTLITLPTGTGKTVIFCHLADRHKNGRVLILAHRNELIQQAAQKVEAVTGHRPDIEMAGQWADRSGFWKTKVVVASVQTMLNRAGRFNSDEFGLLVVDEAHRSAAKSYRNVLEHFQKNPDCKVLGVTATPQRLDKVSLGTVFDSCCFQYGLKDAIDDAYLVPIWTSTVTVQGLDLSDVRRNGGDFVASEMGEVLKQDAVSYEVASATVDIVKDLRSLIFCASVSQAEVMVKILKHSFRVEAASVSAKTHKDERAGILRSFAAGDIQFMCNVGVLTEGYDDPGLRCVVMARPTQSTSLFTQCLGRGTRPLEGVIQSDMTREQRHEAIQASEKKGVVVLDFEDNIGRHRLVNAVDVLAGKMDTSVIDRAKSIIKSSKGGMDVDSAIELSQKQLQEEAEARKEREEKERKLREQMRVKANYTLRENNPFDVLDLKPWKPNAYRDRRYLGSERGIEQGLLKFGVKRNEFQPMNHREKKQLLDTLKKRRNKDMATYAQMRFLRKNNVPANNMSKSDAQIWIGEIQRKKRESAS